MAGSFSNYLENALLNHVFGGGDYTRPATLYAALYTATPGDAGGGTEVAGSGYARKAVTNNATNFPAASGTTPTLKQNGTDIEFAAASGGAWGTITQMAFFDAASGGNLIGWGDIGTPKAIGDGDIARFPANSISITLD